MFPYPITHTEISHPQLLMTENIFQGPSNTPTVVARPLKPLRSRKLHTYSLLSVTTRPGSRSTSSKRPHTSNPIWAAHHQRCHLHRIIPITLCNRTLVRKVRSVGFWKGTLQSKCFLRQNRTETTCRDTSSASGTILETYCVSTGSLRGSNLHSA